MLETRPREESRGSGYDFIVTDSESEQSIRPLLTSVADPRLVRHSHHPQTWSTSPINYYSTYTGFPSLLEPRPSYHNIARNNDRSYSEIMTTTAHVVGEGYSSRNPVPTIQKFQGMTQVLSFLMPPKRTHRRISRRREDWSRQVTSTHPSYTSSGRLE